MTDQLPNQDTPPKTENPDAPTPNHDSSVFGNFFKQGNNNASYNNQAAPGMLTTLSNAKGRIGIVGIIIVVAAAYALNINPMNALKFFSGSQTQSPPAFHQTTQAR